MKRCHTEPRIEKGKGNSREKYSTDDPGEEVFQFLEQTQNDAGETGCVQPLIEKNEENEYQKQRRHFFKGLAPEGGGEELHWLDPHGRKENVKSGERRKGEEGEVLEGFFQVESERNERLFGVVKIFKENETEEKNKKNIGDILGEERQTEKNSGEDEIAERAAFLKYEIREEGKRSEYPKQRIGVDDLGYADQDRGESDKSEAEQGVSSSEQAFQKKVEKRQAQRDKKKLWETESEVVAFHIVFEADDFALVVRGTVFFG